MSGAAPAIYECVVRHVRHDPLEHAFSYRTASWLVDVDALPALPWWLRPLARWRADDHLRGPGTTLRERATDVLVEHGIVAGPGAGPARVLMLAHPRVLGYVFNPLTVFWCLDGEGRTIAAVAEVHNTYGGRHAYVLDPAVDDRWRGVVKELYVSPFHDVSGSYRLHLPVPSETLNLDVVLDRPGARPFVATLRGTRRAVTASAVVRLGLRHPVAPLRDAVRIRRQAIGLMLRGLRLRPRPTPTGEGARPSSRGPAPTDPPEVSS